MRDFPFMGICFINLGIRCFGGFQTVLQRLCKPMCKPEITMKATVNVLCYKSETLKNVNNKALSLKRKDKVLDNVRNVPK